MEIFRCEQNSDDWYKLRVGIPTSSCFDFVMAKPGPKGGVAKTRQTYMWKLAGERITGEPMDNYTNWHMERGKEMEPEARNMYAFDNDAEPQLVGFIRNGDKGASPDAFLGDDGLLEIKTKLPHLLIPLLLGGEFPPEHKAQCQGQLWVAERDWLDFVAYWPRMPIFVTRITRDEPYIKDLSAAVAVFNRELADMVGEVKAYGKTPLPITAAG